MTTSWDTVGLSMVGMLAIRSAGPVMSSDRPLPPRANTFISLLAPALLAALIAVDTFSAAAPHTLTLNDRDLGLAAAGVAVALRLPLTVVIVIAAAVTALLRLVS